MVYKSTVDGQIFSSPNHPTDPASLAFFHPMQRNWYCSYTICRLLAFSAVCNDWYRKFFSISESALIFHILYDYRFVGISAVSSSRTYSPYRLEETTFSSFHQTLCFWIKNEILEKNWLENIKTIFSNVILSFQFCIRIIGRHLYSRLSIFIGQSSFYCYNDAWK